MATPSGSKAADGRGPHNAVTPQSQPHLPNFTSPAPRSMPSPAAHRQAGKSPFTAATQSHTVSSTTAQNHPTVGSSGSASKALLGSSPAAAMMNFESPGPMSFSLSQLGNVDAAIPMVPGISGLSGLGLLPLAGATTDEEKWRRLNEIIEKLRSRPGSVSVQHILSLARSVGLDTDSAHEGSRTEINLAGRTVILELEMLAQEVTKVDVQFTSSAPSLEVASGTASAIFRKSLTPASNGSSISLSLNNFASNLQKLAKIDRKHASDNFNGFEAIAGVYTSLQRLYEHERSIAEQLFETAEDKKDKAAIEVTCKKSGRPRMNEGDFIGLDLDYWMTRRHIPPSSRTTSRADQTVEDGLFTMSIECEEQPPGSMIQPARISEAWLSQDVEKAPDVADEQSAKIIDWLEPPPTLTQPNMPVDPSADVTMDQGDGKLPTVRFVAKLRPPLIIPGDAATQSGLLQHSIYHTLPSYVGSLLLYKDPLDVLNTTTNLPPKDIFAERKMFRDGTALNKHANTLRLRSYEQSILLHEIPFDHPKQIIQLLPTLRQYAFLNTMLRSSFPNAKTSPPTKIKSRWNLNQPPSNIDMTFSTMPNPRLALTFARSGDDPSAQPDIQSQAVTLDDFFASDDTVQSRPPVSVNISVLSNAEIVVGENNIDVKQKGTTTTDDVKKSLARALDMAADLDIWVEFVKSQAS